MAALLAGGALALIALSIAWNTLGSDAVLAPATERGITSACVTSSLAALWFAGGRDESIVALLALALSGFFLALTFLSGLPRQEPAAAVGRTAPDFAATDASGNPFRLSSLRGAAVLLKFFRGSWCPYCVAELRALDALAPRFAALGVRLVAICPDRVDELAKLARARSWQVLLLADPTNRVGRLYNVQNRNFTPKRGPMRELVIPTSILVDAGGTVRWIDQASDFRQRTPAASVLEEVRHTLAGSGMIGSQDAGVSPTAQSSVCGSERMIGSS